MVVKGKDARNRTLEKLLRILWVGDVKGAVSYLEDLPSSIIKNPKWLEEQINYLKRKEYCITSYAVRAGLGLRNSSNPVEKANDILGCPETETQWNVMVRRWKQCPCCY